MAVAIGSALQAPPLVLFSLVPVGYATNVLGGAGGPLAVLVIAIIAAECGKMVSKETKVDILVTPIVTVLVGIGAAYLIAPPHRRGGLRRGQHHHVGHGAAALLHGHPGLGDRGRGPHLAHLQRRHLRGPGPHRLGRRGGGGRVLRPDGGLCHPLLPGEPVGRPGVSKGLGTSMLQMGNIVRNPKIWIPPTLASAITGPIATCVFHLQMNGTAVSSGMGTCGLVGPIGVYTGWVNDIAQGLRGPIGGMDWLGMILICFVLPGVLTWLIGIPCRKAGWIKDGDLKLEN